MDASIGRVIQTLKDNHQYQNTLIAFTSDNGGQLNIGASNGSWRGGKEELYEGGIRVPFGIVWQEMIKPNTRTSGIALLMDLLPTFCEAARVKVKNPIDGRSFLPALIKENPAGEEKPRTLFWMRREGGSFYHGKDYYAVRRGRWKLMQNHPYMPFRLYDLETDAREQNDVAKDNSQIVEELSEALRAHLQQAGAVAWQKARE